MYIDTHCHLEDEKFTDIDEVVKEFRNNCVTKVINMGCDINTSKLAKNLAEKYQEIYYAVGFHPENATKFDDHALDELRYLANSDKCVAIGEIGLDYYWDDTKKVEQKKCFIEQIKLANELKLPVSIHSREATLDTLNTLRENKPLYSGVLHCYSGSVESANEYIKMGLKIGFGGTVTFKNAKNIVEVASKIPSEFILTETDSPYLAPVPFRGSINSPKNIPQIVAKLAFIRGVSPDKLAEQVLKNAKQLFYKIK